jgi:hypothetical protein
LIGHSTDIAHSRQKSLNWLAASAVYTAVLVIERCPRLLNGPRVVTFGGDRIAASVAKHGRGRFELQTESTTGPLFSNRSG